MEQTIRSRDKKAASQAKQAAKKVKLTGPKRKPGRQKGGKNKPKANMILNPELLRIPSILNALRLLNHTLEPGGHFLNIEAVTYAGFRDNQAWVPGSFFQFPAQLEDKDAEIFHLTDFRIAPHVG
jgi:hypothetical protein